MDGMRMKRAVFSTTIFLAVLFLFPAPAPARSEGNAAEAVTAMKAVTALKAVLKAYVEGRYHWQDVRIRNLTLNGKDKYGLPTDIGVLKNPPGRTVFNLGFAGGREIKATAEVTAYATVIKARRLLRQGSIIGPDDVYPAIEDVSGLEEGSFRDESSLIGSQLTQSVGPGVTIAGYMVSSSPLVKRGQKVNIVLETPAFRISTIGRIQQDARVGSYAEVLNISSRKLLWGVLSDPGTVRIETVDGR